MSNFNPMLNQMNAMMQQGAMQQGFAQPQFQQQFQQPQFQQQFQQPQFQQQQMQAPQVNPVETCYHLAINELYKTTANMANRSALHNTLYNVFEQERRNNGVGQLHSIVNALITAMASASLGSNPHTQPHQLTPSIVDKTYGILLVVYAMQKPELVNGLDQTTIQSLCSQLGTLQQILDMSIPGSGMRLAIPGYNVVNQAPGLQPTQFQMNQPAQYPQMQPMATPMQMQPMGVSATSYGINTNTPPMMQNPNVAMQDNRYGAGSFDEYGRDYHHGLSQARPQVPCGVDPVLSKVKWSRPGDVVKDQQPEVKLSNDPRTTEQYATQGVVQEYSTPGLAAQQQQPAPIPRVEQQKANQPMMPQFGAPQGLPFDPMRYMNETHLAVGSVVADDMSHITELTPEEEFALFDDNLGEEIHNGDGVPSFSDIFQQPSNWDAAAQQKAINLQNHETQNIHEVKQQVLNTLPGVEEAQARINKELNEAKERNSSTVLSEDGLPDGWMYANYNKPKNHLLNILREHRTPECPFGIAHYSDVSTLVYRMTDDGKVEQRVVGVPVDRLKHDISLINEPMTEEVALRHEVFLPIKPMALEKAVQIIKEEEGDSVKVTEAFDEADLFTVGDTIIASNRQEAMLIAAGRSSAVGKTYANKHGYEFHFREATIISGMKDAGEQLVEDELLAKLTDISTCRNLMEVAQVVKMVRSEGIISQSGLSKITDNMIRVLNDVLTNDYGYAGSLILETEQNFEDELVEFIVYMDSNPEHREVLDLMHRRWNSLLTRMCNLLTGKERDDVIEAISARYGDEAEGVREVLENTIIAETLHSVTTLKLTADQLGIDISDDIFVINSTKTPYLYELAGNTLKRCADEGVYYDTHRVITHDGYQFDFRRGGLGDGSVYIANRK